MRSAYRGLWLLPLLLSACGFHLRGSYAVPAAVHELQLQLDPGSALYQPLRNELRLGGFEPDGGEVTLEITYDQLAKQISSTDNRAKVAEYTLVYEVRYQLRRGTEILSPERRLLLRRSYQYDSTAIVGKSAEEATLIQELRDDAARQLVQQLGFFKPGTSPSP